MFHSPHKKSPRSLIRHAIIAALLLGTFTRTDAKDPHGHLAERLETRRWSTLEFAVTGIVSDYTVRKSIQLHRTSRPGSVYLRKTADRVTHHGKISENRLLEIEAALKKLCSQLEPQPPQNPVPSDGDTIVGIEVKILDDDQNVHTGFVAPGNKLTPPQKQLSDYFTTLNEAFSKTAPPRNK